jgi:hypothetical protein
MRAFAPSNSTHDQPAVPLPGFNRHDVTQAPAAPAMTDAQPAPIASDGARALAEEPPAPGSNARLADDLRSLAAALSMADPPAAARVRDLADATQAGNLDRLAALDLRAVSDPRRIETSAGDYFRTQSSWRFMPALANGLAWARNLATLGAIIYTCILLSQGGATLAGALPSLLWLLAGVAFLTLAAAAAQQLSREVYAARSDRQAAVLRRQAEDALSYLEQALAAERYRQAPGQAALRVSEAVAHFESHAVELLDLLNAERGRVETLADRRERELGDLQLFTEQLNGSTQNLLRGNQDIGALYTQLQMAVRQLTDQVAASGEQQQRLLQALNTSAGNTAVLKDAISFIGHNIDSAIAELKRSAAQNSSGMQNIFAAAGELRKVSGAILEGETTLRAALAETRDANRALVEGIQGPAIRTASAAETTNRVLGAIAQMSSDLAAVSRSNQQLAAQLTAAGEQQAVLLTTVQNMTARGELPARR